MTPHSVSARRLWQLVYQTLDQSDDIIILLERATDKADNPVIVAVNEAFHWATGYSNDELFGQPLLKLASREATAEVQAAIVASIEKHETLRTELPCVSRSGQQFWLGLHLMPAAEAGSDNFVLLGRDITDALQTRQQQAAIQSLLAKVFLCVDAAVAIIGDEGRILMTNPCMDRLLGYKPNALVGHNSLDMIAAGPRVEILAAHQRQSEDGKDFTIETTVLRSDGAELPAKLSSTLIERHDLKHFRVVTLFPTEPQPSEHKPARTSPRQAAAPAESVPAALEPAAPSRKPMRVQIAGKIKLIGLEDVKTALGDRWPAAAVRAMAAAENVLKQRLGPRDDYGRTDDSGFVICFGDATEEAAAFLAATTARDIKNRLIGQGETADAAHVSAITDSVQVPDEPDQSIGLLAGLIEERMAARLAEIENEAREKLKEAVGEAECELQSIRGRDRNETLAHFARLPALLERKMYSALAALPAAEYKDFDIDRTMLGLATAAASRGLLNGSNQPILVTVGFDIFNTRVRTDHYITACQKLDARVRRRLILVLTDLPDGIPKSRVLECVTRLRPFCRGVGFAVRELEAPPVDLSNAGVPIVVVMADNLHGVDANTKARLTKLIGALHAQRSRLLVRHVASWDQASNLMATGVDMVSLAA